MRRFSVLGVAAILALVSLAPRLSAQTGTHDAFRSIALVIGEAAYVNAPKLGNSRNDAVAMASTLRDLGFDVVSSFDGSRDDLEKAITTFLGRLRSSEIAFVYYAGHGVQNRGSNYIVPVDATIDANTNFERQFISISGLLERLEAAVPSTAAKIVVLDACRDSPWAAISEKQTGEQAGGFAPIGPAKDAE